MPDATDALDHGPVVLAGYALIQAFLLAFTYYAVTSFGLGRRGFMHVAMPWYLVVPGAWLIVLYFTVRALVPRVRAGT